MARRREPEPLRLASGWPPELASRLHPFWRADHAAVVEKYAEFLTPAQIASSTGRNLYQSVINGWAIAAGFTTATGQADWNALRAAGVIPGPPSRRR